LAAMVSSSRCRERTRVAEGHRTIGETIRGTAE